MVLILLLLSDPCVWSVFTSSGYQLFSKEMLVQLRDVKANERLQEIGRRWVALSDEDKRHWNRRKDAMWVQYRKDLAKFKKVRHVSHKSVDYFKKAAVEHATLESRHGDSCHGDGDVSHSSNPYYNQ